MSLSRRRPKRKNTIPNGASLQSYADTDNFLTQHHNKHKADSTCKAAKASSREEEKCEKSKNETVEAVDTNIGIKYMDTESLSSEKEGNTKDTSTATSASTCASSTTSAFDLPSRQDSNAIPPAMYKNHQRVYAKDDATGLLYPAVVRKTMWGPKSHQVKVTYLTIDSLLDETNNGDTDKVQTNANGGDGEEEEYDRYNVETNTYHYFVHYLGWNVKWDRWAEELCIYEDSPSTQELASKIMKEYKSVKPKKKNQKMSIESLNAWMKRRNEIEEDHYRMEKQKLSDIGSSDVETVGVKQNDQNKAVYDDGKMSKGVMGKVKTSPKKNDLQSQSITTPKSSDNNEMPKSAKSNKFSDKRLNKEILERQAQLLQKGLQMKMKRSLSDRLHLPFTLKKVLVDEWEVITQCGMVHNLPAKVTVRNALDKYLESKLEVLRKEEKSVNYDAVANDKRESEHNLKELKRLEREWVEMTDGVALVFDQALPVHLLFCQERGQYDSFRKLIRAQIKNATVTDSDAICTSVNSSESCKVGNAPCSSATPVTAAAIKCTIPNFLPQKMSEIYGCEHLLRLFIRLPSVIAATPTISEVYARRIFSKLGDFVRFLQKHQSELFAGAYKKP